MHRKTYYLFGKSFGHEVKQYSDKKIYANEE